MSEYINNVTRRKEILKNVLRQLHAGKSVEEVKAEFGALAREAGSSEIAEIEQMLIEEGVRPEEIQSLCDVHVALFRDGLEEARPPETTPGHPVFTFRAENQLIERTLNSLRAAVEECGKTPAAPARIRAALEALADVDRHYRRKEYLLFPFLERYGFTGPSKVMWGIHDELRAALRALLEQTAKPQGVCGDIHENAQKLETGMREMIYKEEKILFPAALQHLKEVDWAAIRAQEAEIGYYQVRPSNEWQPVVAQIHAPASQSVAAAPVAPADGLLPLDTGALSLEQINLLLTHLPIDITFVDENDEVRYFSQGPERIFDRQPAIIGRKVQNCHPPQSLARVQAILDDFRSGTRSTAEFWIPFGPRFVHIRYFAMRDAQGAYRGALEVTQDIAPIRALEGEKRL